MERRNLLLSILSLFSCAKPPKDLSQVLPQRAARSWERSAVNRISEIPPTVSTLGVADAAETTYKGAGVVTVRVFRMKAETSAFELMQKWSPTQGIAAYRGTYFFVGTPQGTDPQSVASLLRALQEAVSLN